MASQKGKSRAEGKAEEKVASPTPEEARAAAKQRTRENIKSIVGAILLFLFLRTFLIEAYRIPSGSMIPALLINDWLFVNKLAYGPHVPFTNFNLPGYREPQRFDVVVFKSPLQIDQPHDPHPTLVKRLIGLPGDTLYMRNDLLFINGVETPQKGDELKNPMFDPDYHDPLFVWQDAHEITGSRFGDPPEVSTVGNWGPLVVPPGFYFMMGDNRHSSKDSRYWGLVPRENIRGRPLMVYYSFTPSAESDRALPALTDIRWGRLGHFIK